MLGRGMHAGPVLTLAAGCLVAAMALPAAQRQPERAVDLIRVDLAVVTADGTPITDLQADDLTVRLGGRQRDVRSLQLVRSDAAPADGLPAPYGTNAAGAAGRTLYLTLDEDSFRPGREAALREAVDTMLAGLGPADRVALVTLPLGGVRVPLTADRARVRNALGGIAGRGLAGETGSDLACRTRTTLEALIGFLGTLGFRDDPATVLFATGGLAAPRRDAPVTLAPGRCELPVAIYRRVAEAAAGPRAEFYVLQAADILNTGGVQTETIAGTGYRGSDNPVEGLEHLAGVTGGRLLHVSAASAGGLERVLRETSAYYIAGLDPLPSDRTGRPQPLEVRVSRPDAHVRARSQVAFAKPDAVARRPVNPSPRQMLSVMDVFRDLPIRAGAFTSLDADGRTLRVTTIVEPIEPATKLTSLVTALFDRDGKPVANWVATETELARPVLIGAMAVEPGAYRMRAAAIDATGRSGTADVDIDVDLAQTGSLKLSSLVLGLSRDGGFVPRLEFSTEPVGIGLVEIYGGAPGMRLSADLEIARTLNGPALVSVPLSISQSDEGRYSARGAIPVAALAPGDYAVRAVIGAEGQPPTRVVRTLRKR
jgi:hypothetical protein